MRVSNNNGCRSRVAIISLAIFFLLGINSSAQESFGYSFQLLKSSKPLKQKIVDTRDWHRFTGLRDNIVLEEMSGVGSIGSPLLLFPGVKNPLIYRDPRPEMSQVQYVDIGTKLDLTVTRAANGFLKVLTRGETSSSAPLAQFQERTEVAVFESATLLKRGQVAIIGTFSGPIAIRHLISHFPEANFTENDTFQMVVSIR